MPRFLLLVATLSVPPCVRLGVRVALVAHLLAVLGDVDDDLDLLDRNDVLDAVGGVGRGTDDLARVGGAFRLGRRRSDDGSGRGRRRLLDDGDILGLDGLGGGRWSWSWSGLGLWCGRGLDVVHRDTTGALRAGGRVALSRDGGAGDDKRRCLVWGTG